MALAATVLRVPLAWFPSRVGGGPAFFVRRQADVTPNMTFPKFTTDKIVRRLRWVTLMVMLADAVITLIGQPPTFWHDPKVANEGEPIVRFFLVRGFFTYAFVGSLYVIGSLVLASITPRNIGMTILFFLLLEHFWGVTSWLVYSMGANIRLQDAFELGIAALIALAVCQAPDRHE